MKAILSISLLFSLTLSSALAISLESIGLVNKTVEVARGVANRVQNFFYTAPTFPTTTVSPNDYTTKCVDPNNSTDENCTRSLLNVPEKSCPEGEKIHNGTSPIRWVGANTFTIGSMSLCGIMVTDSECYTEISGSKTAYERKKNHLGCEQNTYCGVIDINHADYSTRHIAQRLRKTVQLDV